VAGTKLAQPIEHYTASIAQPLDLVALDRVNRPHGGPIWITTLNGFRGYRGGEQLVEAVIEGKATMSDVRYVELHGSRVAYREDGMARLCCGSTAWRLPERRREGPAGPDTVRPGNRSTIC
jgi:hypothetical protein